MIEVAVFGEAQEALRGVVDRIAGDQWEREVPEGMRYLDGQRTVRDIVNHHARDDAWVPEVLAGRTLAEVGDRYDGDLLGADPRAAYKEFAERATAAVRDCTDFERPVHLSYGAFPARTYLLHIIIFRGFQAYDLARFLGMRPQLSDALVAGLSELIAPHAERLRGLGVFGPAVPVAADAPPLDRLLGLSGRDPAQ
jgi:uncharacterized protein (TIGR03086 family)